MVHENQTVPPSLSQQGELRPASKKSAIIQCILQMQHQTPNEHPVVKTKILDGAVIINMLPLLVKVELLRITQWKSSCLTFVTI